jgi:hypothetical protein
MSAAAIRIPETLIVSVAFGRVLPFDDGLAETQPIDLITSAGAQS